MRTVPACDVCQTNKRPSVGRCMNCGSQICKYHRVHSNNEDFCKECYKLTSTGRGVMHIL